MGDDKRLEVPMSSELTWLVEGTSVMVHKPEYCRSSKKARWVCRRGKPAVERSWNRALSEWND